MGFHLQKLDVKIEKQAVVDDLNEPVKYVIIRFNIVANPYLWNQRAVLEYKHYYQQVVKTVIQKYFLPGLDKNQTAD